MARARRVLVKDGFYHIYNRGVEKRVIFEMNNDYRIFLKLVVKNLVDAKHKVFAYCLMKNHFHLFIQNCGTDLSVAMQNLQGQYAQYYNYRNDRVGPLYQGRFNSKHVNKESYSLQIIRYIHRNPLEAGLVSRIEDYAWSSYRTYFDKKFDIVPVDSVWMLSQLNKNTDIAKKLFRNFHRDAGGDTGV